MLQHRSSQVHLITEVTGLPSSAMTTVLINLDITCRPLVCRSPKSRAISHNLNHPPFLATAAICGAFPSHNSILLSVQLPNHLLHLFHVGCGTAHAHMHCRPETKSKVRPKKNTLGQVQRSFFRSDVIAIVRCIMSEMSNDNQRTRGMCMNMYNNQRTRCMCMYMYDNQRSRCLCAM